MPPIHSSPHPRNDLDLNVDWNPKEDSMENPYPNAGGVPPGYDYGDWAGGGNVAGRDRHSFPMQGHSPVLSHASQFDTGTGRRGGRGNTHSNRTHHYSHRHAKSNNMNTYSWPHLQRASGFDGRAPRMHARHAYVSDEEDEEDPEGFDEENFEYDPYDEEEPAFLPPKMGQARGRAWDSSDEEEPIYDLEDEEYFDEEDEDEDEEEDEEYAAEVRANLRQHGGRPIPQRGHPPRHRGGMRRSGPPPLETPPDTPPALARGMPVPRGMDPRMMRGRGMGPRMGNRGGVRMVPVHGGPVRGGPPRGAPRGAARGNGMPVRRGRVTMKRARFTDSPSSSSGDGWAFHHGAARVRRSNAGGSLKKAIRWITNSTPIKLNPFLRTGTLFNPATRTEWDVRLPPIPVRAGVPVDFGTAQFSEPATSPPVPFLCLVVPIPGLGGAAWTVNVMPTGSPYATALQMPSSPYSFTGSPNSPARSPFRRHEAGYGPLTPIVRCADVLYALYAMLQRRATRADFLALDHRRRERVGREFWMRCQAMGHSAAANMGAVQPDMGGEAALPTLVQEETNRHVISGVKRIDFMAGKTRWEGLDSSDGEDEWIVRLGHSQT